MLYLMPPKGLFTSPWRGVCYNKAIEPTPFDTIWRLWQARLEEEKVSGAVLKWRRRIMRLLSPPTWLHRPYGYCLLLQADGYHAVNFFGRWVLWAMRVSDWLVLAFFRRRGESAYLALRYYDPSGRYMTP